MRTAGCVQVVFLLVQSTTATFLVLLILATHIPLYTVLKR